LTLPVSVAVAKLTLCADPVDADGAEAAAAGAAAARPARHRASAATDARRRCRPARSKGLLIATRIA
jgi:hypothetical protein